MKKQLGMAAALGAILCAGLAATANDQQSPANQAPPAEQAPTSRASDQRSEIYYDYMMGTLYEHEYESSNQSEDANQAIEYYKKAYALDSTSGVIGEKLAEMYFVAQRIREAVTEAQGVIRRDPSNLPARRLLARIYVRSLGDLTDAAQQQGTIAMAIDQLKQIVRLDPSDSDSALWLARLDRLTNANDAAESVLRGVLANEPDNSNAVQQLAQLLIDEGKPAAAVEMLQQSLEKNPVAPLYDQLGDAYTQIHDAKNAEDAYRHAAELEPDQASHIHGLAQSLLDQGKYAEAVEQYQKLVQMEPDDSDNYLRLSDVYRQLHQLDKAEEQILLAKQRAPGNLEVIYDEASIYELEGRYDDAVRVLSDAVSEVKEQSESTPTRRRTLAILYQALGQEYREQQNYAAAVNTFREMAALGTEEDRRGRALIVDTYREAHDLPHAFEEAKKAVSDYPNDRSLIVSQALLYGFNNQPDEAAQGLKPLLNNSADDMEIYLDLAQVYLEGQRYSDAEQALRSAAKLAMQNSDRETVGFLLGGVYERQKKYDQAEQSFKSVLALDPRNAPALNYYGYMLADRGVRLDEAVDLVQRALAEEPNNAAYLDSLGWAYYKQDKLPEAESYLRKALQHESSDPTMLTHLGDILAKSGQTDLAATEWEKALDQWHHALPADFEADKVAALEQKIAGVRHRMAQQKLPEDKAR